MKTILKPAAILTAVCLLVTLAVAGVNGLTRDAIAKSEAAAAQASMAALIPGADFTPVKAAGESQEIYRAGDKGFVFVSAATGYGGDVKVMTALDGEGAVLGVVVLSCDDETPGLGQNCKKPAFTDQFAGKSDSVELTKNGGDIVAVTSATYTSTAVKTCVNRALADYRLVKEGAQ